jgi:hypothetical protein
MGASFASSRPVEAIDPLPATPENLAKLGG